MTIYRTSVELNARSLATAKERAHKLATSLQDALGKARTFNDPNLSPAGVAAKRRELEDAFRAAARAELETLRTDVTNSKTYLDQAAREATQLASDPTTLIRAEQKWRQVERVLDAGGDILAQVARADADTALAIAEFGPSWVEASTPRPSGLSGVIAASLTEQRHVGTDPLRQAVYARLAAVTQQDDLRELLQATVRATAAEETAEPWMQAASDLVEHGRADMLGAALASQVADAPTAA